MKALGRILQAMDTLREAGVIGFWRNRARARFIVVTFRCLGHLAKAKGRVTDTDIAATVDLMRRLRLNDEQRASARDSFREGKSAQQDTAWLTRQLRHRLARSNDQRTLFMQCQLQLAYADGQLGPTDRALIRQWSRALGLRSADLHRVHEQTLQRLARQRAAERRLPAAMTPDAARSVLGVSPDAAPADVRRQYQRAMNRYHPDKWVGRTVTAEERAEAEGRVRQLQQAYETLKQR